MIIANKSGNNWNTPFRSKRSLEKCTFERKKSTKGKVETFPRKEDSKQITVFFSVSFFTPNSRSHLNGIFCSMQFYRNLPFLTRLCSIIWHFHTFFHLGWLDLHCSTKYVNTAREYKRNRIAGIVGSFGNRRYVISYGCATIPKNNFHTKFHTAFLKWISHPKEILKPLVVN